METVQAPVSSEDSSLTIAGERLIRISAVAMTLIVTGASAILSWNGLRDLGINAGFQGLSVMLPISIDGMLFLGSIQVIHASLTNQSARYGWAMTTVGISLSILGNLMSVPDSDFLTKVVHGIPPVMMALSTEALVRVIKLRIHKQQEALAIVEQEARREAKRQEREAQATALKEARSRKDSKVLLSQSKRGGKKVNADDAEVAVYKEILNTLPATSKIGKVEAILLRHPEARTSHIAHALEVDPRSLGTTVQRAKTKLLRNDSTVTTGSPANTSEKPQDAFEDIVRNL